MRHIPSLLILGILAVFCIDACAEAFRLQTVSLPETMNETTTRLIQLTDADADGLVDLFVGNGEGAVALILQERSAGFTHPRMFGCALPSDALWYTVSSAGRDRLGLIYADATAVWYRALTDAGWSTPERLANQTGIPSTKTGPAALLDPERLPWCPSGCVPIVGDSAISFLPGQSTLSTGTQVKHRLDVSMDSGAWGVGGGSVSVFASETWLFPEVENQSPDSVDRKVLSEYLKRYRESRGKAFHSLEDLNRDGVKDLVIYSYRWGIDPKTALVMFFRRSDGTFPEKPDRILRARGVPIEWDHSRPAGFRSPFMDVNRDGVDDLLFTEIETHAISAQNILRTFIDASVRWQLTIRLGQKDGMFSTRPDKTVSISGIPPFFDDDGRMVRTSGDFNGDGSPDLFVRRDLVTVNLFFSRPENGLFADVPDAILAVPYQGRKIIRDLNGDGRDDIVMTNRKTGEVSVWITQ